MDTGISRRSFLGGAIAFGALGMAGCAGAPPGGSGGRLPAQGEYLIRNGFVMTMEPGVADIPDGSVHVRGGRIVAVSAGVEAPGAEVLDGRGMIVLPGLVETHWHMWNTLLRSMAGDRTEHGYFPTARQLGEKYLPGDMYQGTRLSAAEAIFSGTTTVHDWCHNIRGPEYADEDLRALRESGIRARFSYGAAQGQSPDTSIDTADIARLQKNWNALSNDGLLTLGLAWRGTATSATGAIGAAAWRNDFDAARALGIPISVHANNARARAGAIAVMAKEKCLGRDVQVIHAIWLTKEELKALADSGSAVSLSPYTELRIGFGFPATGELLAAGIPVGLSVDTTTLSGSADMFAIMKAIQNIENARTENEFKLPARRVLELGTIEGARSLGLADRTGSLMPGKRADLIMVNTRDVNLGVFSDPAHMLVEAAQPSNVDTVMVDGRILKRRGRLTAVNVEQVVDEARAALVAVRKRANWW
ncbi:MAG TPA: amidohydrolase family protein [Burkholderiales bacterium]|nr:amidohydrolase family protein [Burkholderiales bacterium]